MKLFVMTEPLFQTSSWCHGIEKGLKETRTRKKINDQFLKDVHELPSHETDAYLLLIGSNLPWLTEMVNVCLIRGIHPVVLSCQSPHRLPGTYSSVTSDIGQSMRCLMAWFQKQGKHAPALYGWNPASLSDLPKKEAFLANAYFSVTKADVYENNGSLEQCFQNFLPHLTQYDCVICVNSFAAIHLNKQLKGQKSTNALLLVSYGTTLFSDMFVPEVHSISLCYEEFGRAAVTICEMLSKNAALDSVNDSIKWRMDSSELSSPEVFAMPQAETQPKAVADQLFYSDVVMQSMLAIENMLYASDSYDRVILQLLLKGSSYEQIAEQCFLASNTVKYRVQKMKKICGCASKSELMRLIRQYSVEEATHRQIF